MWFATQMRTQTHTHTHTNQGQVKTNIAYTLKVLCLRLLSLKALTATEEQGKGFAVLVSVLWCARMVATCTLAGCDNSPKAQGLGLGFGNNTQYLFKVLTEIYQYQVVAKLLWNSSCIQFIFISSTRKKLLFLWGFFIANHRNHSDLMLHAIDQQRQQLQPSLVWSWTRCISWNWQFTGGILRNWMISFTWCVSN